MTLRSLSLYLALCPGAEVSIEWYLAGWKREVERYLNLLLVPWPERVLPSDFRELKRDVETPTDPSYRMFAFDPDRAPLEGGGGRAADRVTTVVDLIARAKQIVGKVDGVVLPECALSQEDYDAIWARIAGERCLLIAGVRCREPNQFCGNRVETRFNVGATPVSLRQAKHHRWKLDKDQIRTYGLASQLHPDTVWWEGIELCRRELKFVALQPWLTVCSLICEDLARQEPMAEIIRSVGPSLVIALLMDGPQLETRWPSRYATVLADDPGSSVLTLSSIGMVGLSRPLGGYTPCRTIALWKDALSAKSVQIDLPGDAQGVVISLVNTENLEQAADGRYDEEPDKTLILGGIHPVKV